MYVVKSLKTARPFHPGPFSFSLPIVFTFVSALFLLLNVYTAGTCKLKSLYWSEWICVIKWF